MLTVYSDILSDKDIKYELFTVKNNIDSDKRPN